MITEDYVSFETAKLLKEKGFDEECQQYYGNYKYPCPTLQMAMKWLREVYKLYITVVPFPLNFEHEDIQDGWGCEVTHLSDLSYDGNYEFFQKRYPIYEDACEAAIRYCLENLIKNEDEEEESGIPVPKTLDEAISTLEKILSDEDREYLLKNGAISMHNSLGRWIRNEWGLWTGSELKDELMNMNKGLNHPDDMSNYIIEEFIKYWNNKI